MHPRRDPPRPMVRIAALLAACGGCGPYTTTFHATSGAAFTGSWQQQTATFDNAVIESASHDVPCPTERVVIMTRSRGPYLVAACGYLLTYAANNLGMKGSAFEYEVTRIARVQMGPGPPDAR